METAGPFLKCHVMSQCLLKKEFEAEVVAYGAAVSRAPEREEDEEW